MYVIIYLNIVYTLIGNIEAVNCINTTRSATLRKLSTTFDFQSQSDNCQKWNDLWFFNSGSYNSAMICADADVTTSAGQRPRARRGADKVIEMQRAASRVRRENSSDIHYRNDVSNVYVHTHVGLDETVHKVV